MNTLMDVDDDCNAFETHFACKNCSLLYLCLWVDVNHRAEPCRPTPDGNECQWPEPGTTPSLGA